jgi:Holliday junction DNA helicase RuvA
MIYHINGDLVEVNPAFAVVECAGVGYLIHITLNTFASISNAKKVKLYTHPIYKEDAEVLFGFYDKSEKEIFVRLISVSGVGGNTARVILSSLSAEEVVEAITHENVTLLKSIKGIGAKTAERIIVDLKDKLSGIEVSAGVSGAVGSAKTEASSALEVLGYAPRQTEKIILQITKEHPGAGVEEIIKQALKRL